MKVLIGQLSHETNTFSSNHTTKEHFQLWEWIFGEEIIKKHENVKDYLGGMLSESQRLNIEVIPTFSAECNPSGIITKETYLELKNNLINSIKECQDYDGVCLALHGGGVAEEVEDIEGDILSEIRKVVGDTIPIVSTLDLHGNVTKEMIQSADALLGVNDYPHTDSYDRGIEAIQLLKNIMNGSVNPTMHLTQIPLLIPSATTHYGPAKVINEICWHFEKETQVIDCTFFHGFVFSDIDEVGASVLTITDNNYKLAKHVSDHVAKEVWGIRDEFIPKFLSPEDGVKAAIEQNKFPVVLNESSDNPGGGAPGDSTFLLSAMISADLDDSCFGFINDPEVANMAHESGAGTFINVELGGKTDSLHGKPLQLRAYVKSLTDGKFIQSSPMWAGKEVNYGKSARLQVGHLDIIVCSVASQTMDEQIFQLHGIDVKECKLIGLKSANHFRAGFKFIAKEIITVESSGLTSSNLFKFEYKNLNKPMYPLVKELHYTK